MPAGPLRDRIVLKKNTPTRDTFADQVPHWSAQATLWARVTQVSGAEGIEARAALATLTYKVEIRAYPTISPDMRIEWTHRGETRTLEILAIVESDKGSMMTLACTEVV